LAVAGGVISAVSQMTVDDEIRRISKSNEEEIKFRDGIK
jgi:hypothetical protein